jgi:hypothetical protein
MSLHSSKQQLDATLEAYVARLCLKCFRCFIVMLQVFHMDVAKVDRDVAYNVASFCSQCFICFPDVCCKCVYLDVAYVSHMLQVFYLDIVYVSAMVSSVFQVFL